jgi:hypothetical protein
MGWVDEREIFLNEFNMLNTTSNIDSKIAQLNDVIASYIQTGGLTDPANTQPFYAKIGPQVDEIRIIKQKYSDLYKKINQKIINHVDDVNVGTTLTDIAAVQAKITTYEKELKDINIDVETAIARDELLRSRNTKRDSHSLFLTDRPIRKTVIPYLWILAIAFIGIGLIMIKMYMPIDSTRIPVNLPEYVYSIIMEFISNRIVLFSLLGASFVTILFLSLKIAGVI